MGAPDQQQLGNIQAPIQQKHEEGVLRQAHWDVNDNENLDAAQDDEQAGANALEEDDDEEDAEAVEDADDTAKEDEDDTNLQQEEEDNEENGAAAAAVDDTDDENFDAAEDHMDDNKIEQLAMEQQGRVVQEKAHLGPDIDQVALHNVDPLNQAPQHEES